MLKNFFRIVLRNLLRNKAFSFINILGLAIGFAACLVIYLYVANEINYDRYHQKGDRVYRLLSYYPSTGETDAIKPGVLYDHINGKVPGVEKMVRIFRWKGTLEHGDQKFNEENLKFSEPGVFDIFSWKFISGDPATALADAHSLVLTRSMAKKYFGDQDPVDKTMLLDNEIRFRVGGVIEDVPENSHFDFDFLGNSEIFKTLNPSALDNWGNASVFYYFLLGPNAQVKDVEETVDKLLRESHPNGDKITVRARLQPLYDIHLFSADVKWDIATHGDISTVYGFALIAFLVLLIACFNFTNLTTASATSRAREVGIRKVIGANRNKLILQFISETFIYALLALILAILIVELSLPYFNNISGKHLVFAPSAVPSLYWIVPAMLLLVSLLAGLYPAFVQSGFRPATILKGSALSGVLGQMHRRRFQLRLRQVLIVLQFTISIGLIIGAVIINNQMRFVRQKSLGFNRDAVYVIENPWDTLMLQRYNQVRNMLSNYTAIEGVAASHNIPGRNLNNNTGSFREKSQPESARMSVGLVSVDTAFFRVMDVAVVRGVDFANPAAGDPARACILNESLAKKFDTDPVGLEMTGFYDGVDRKVVGVINDIHYRSLHEKVKPAAYIVSPVSYPPFSTNIVVRIRKNVVPEAVELIGKTWASLAPQWPLDGYFLDQRLEEHYLADKQVMQVVNVFTLLAIVISLMGLFGLTLFVMRSRTKEIGIRQVHGATAGNLMRMFTGEFALLLLLSNIVAWPVAYWLLLNWVEKFAFRVSIGFFPFLLAGGATLILALMMVAWHVMRTLAANPINALKYE